MSNWSKFDQRGIMARQFLTLCGMPAAILVGTANAESKGTGPTPGPAEGWTALSRPMALVTDGDSLPESGLRVGFVAASQIQTRNSYNRVTGYRGPIEDSHEHGWKLTFSDVQAIAETQITREDRLLGEARRILVCGTSPATTAFCSRKFFGQVAPELERLAQRSYDLTPFCQLDIPFIQDGTRQVEPFRAEQHAYYASLLSHRETAWIPLRGNMSKRIAAVEVSISKLRL